MLEGSAPVGVVWNMSEAEFMPGAAGSSVMSNKRFSPPGPCPVRALSVVNT